MSIEPGTLYVVATPIGNLEDITRRALEVLAQVDVVLAEDTRHSARLLRAYRIRTPTESLRDHNERRATPALIDRLRAGQTMALVSDAGTPLISDPGYHLVSCARKAGVKTVPVPGPCALTCALSVAGLPSDRFCFEGFLPARRAARQTRLTELTSEPRTLIFYEAPHRAEQCLSDLASAFGSDRFASVARELTKVFEEVVSGTLSELLEWSRSSDDHRKGEFVILVDGAPAAARREELGDGERILRVLLEELPLSKAVRVAARLTGIKRNRLYERAVTLAQPFGSE